PRSAPPCGARGAAGGWRRASRCRNSAPVAVPVLQARPRQAECAHAELLLMREIVHDAGVVTGLEQAVDTNAARIVGETLRTAGYTEAAITGVLGDDAFSARQKDLPVLLRRLPQSRLGTVVRAFFLVQPVPADELTRAIGDRGVAALEAAGVAEVGDEVAPRLRILPVADLLVASDDDPRREGDLQPDFVAAYTAASRLCDALTPRPEVDRALDVGTGSGVHAMLAARHAREV